KRWILIGVLSHPLVLVEVAVAGGEELRERWSLQQRRATDAGGHPDTEDLGSEDPLRRHDLLGHAAREHVHFRRRPIENEHQELVAAVTRDQILASRAAEKDRSDVAEDAVAGEMAEGVVDDFEVVEIKQNQVD